MGEAFDWEIRLALALGLLVAVGALGYGVLETNWGGATAVPPAAGAESVAGAVRGRKTASENKPSIRRLPKRRIDELRRQQQIELMRRRANQPGPAPLPLRRPKPRQDSPHQD